MKKQLIKNQNKKKAIRKVKKIDLSDFLKNYHFLKNQKIGLAVSGGIDSMVLLDIFRKERKKLNLDLYALYFNHRWRKKSTYDARLIEKYCYKHKIKFLSGEATDRIIKKEEMARNQRYSFFKDKSKEFKLNLICTAHHKDDQVETVLFRLSRGTGPYGLLPIKQSANFTSNVIIFRPLLEFTKADIYHYAVKNKINYIYDKTNENLKYRRNLVRKKVIPILKQINKNVLDNIVKCSNLIYSQTLALDELFLNLSRKIEINSPYLWHRNKFLQLSNHIQKAYIYWFLTKYKIKGSLKNTEVIKDLIHTKGKINLSMGITLNVNERQIYFHENKKNNRLEPSNEIITRVTFNGRKQKLFLGQKLLVIKPFNYKSSIKKFPQDKENIAYVNFSPYKEKIITLRYRKPGDVFQPFGLQNIVKLKKYLINKKISREKRSNTPLVCFNNEVLWIPGYSLSNKLKVLNKPSHVLMLKNLKKSKSS